MRHRPGITLVEVLVAIFIMAIGLLAILTLFPLGALRMSESLQSDRTAAAASEAAGIGDAFGMRQDPQFDPPAAVAFAGFQMPRSARMSTRHDRSRRTEPTLCPGRPAR